MFSTYVLLSQKTGKRYVGSTQNLALRLLRHNRGETISTSTGIPWVIIHQENFPTRPEAVRRERFLKSGQGRAWLDSLLPRATA
jgi:putative endonuclease